MHVKKYVWLVPLFAIIACAEPMSPPVEAEIVKGKTADAVLVNEKFDAAFDFGNPCNGEQIIGTATYHVFVATVNTRSGLSSANSSVSITWKGVGATTQTEYNGKLFSGINYTSGAGATQVSARDDLHVISKGSAPDFTATVYVHITIDANGDPKVIHEVYDSRCK